MREGGAGSDHGAGRGLELGCVEVTDVQVPQDASAEEPAEASPEQIGVVEPAVDPVGSKTSKIAQGAGHAM